MNLGLREVNEVGENYKTREKIIHHIGILSRYRCTQQVDRNRVRAMIHEYISKFTDFCFKISDTNL